MLVLGHNVPLLASAVPALLAAFGGSLHCAVMCGPIRLLTSQAASARVSYQLGRGISYAGLGALAGWLGWSIPPWALVGLLLAALAAFLLGTRLPPVLGQARKQILVRAAQHPFWLGLASALLPCGLLHTWILVAVAASTPAAGALILGALWLGTLPALEVGSWIVARPLQAAKRAFPRATPVAIAILALAPLLWRSHLAWSTPAHAPMACHGHMHVPAIQSAGASAPAAHKH